MAIDTTKRIDDGHIADNSADFITLETLIDRYGLACVFETVALICSAKADHIRENWQDEPLAPWLGPCCNYRAACP